MTHAQDGQPEGFGPYAHEDRDALQNDLTRRFAYHPVDTDSRQTAHETVRAEAYALAAAFADLVPPTRERALAFEAVEVAMYWANAGIARHYQTATDREQPARRPMTAGELGLVEGTPAGRQDVDPDPATETQNPASLVETEDMPQPAQPGPDGPVAPPRNVTEPAEAPHVPHVAPEHADNLRDAPQPFGGQPEPEVADPDTDTSP